MSDESREHASRVREYYEATTEQGYLRAWAGDALGFHFGLSDGDAYEHEAALLEANRVVAERAGLRDGMRVLDAGCGVGGSAFWVAERYDVEVVGVTIDPNQVEIATRVANQKGLSGRVRFVCADLLNDEIPGGPFDVAWHIESFCHIYEPGRYLARVVGTLADGGMFVSLDLHRGGEDVRGECAAMCDGWRLPSLLSPEGLAEALAQAGFVDARVADLTVRTRASASRLGAMASVRMTQLRLQRALLGEADPIYAGHTAAALGAAAGLSSGAVRYALVSARRG